MSESNLNNFIDDGTFLLQELHQQGLYGSIAEDAIGCGNFHFRVSSGSATDVSET